MKNETERERPRGAFLKSNFESVRLTFRSILETKMGWTIPLIIVLLFLACILGLISLVPVISPFIYPLF